MLGFQSYRELFDPLEKEDYPRSGIIFCNTKSNLRGDGVAALAKTGIQNGFIKVDGLYTEKSYLKISTYIGGDNDHLAKNPVVIELAKESYKLPDSDLFPLFLLPDKNSQLNWVNRNEW